MAARKTGKSRAEDPIDFVGDAASVGHSAGAAANVGKLAVRLAKLLEQAATLQAEMAGLSDEIREIEERTLPDAMAELGPGVTSFPLSSGAVIKVETIIGASLPKGDVERYAQGLSYLRKNGHGDLVKDELRVELGRGKDNVARDIIAYAKTTHDVDMRREESVHAQTLSAWAREQIKAGKNIPTTLFGVYQARRATIKMPAKRSK